VFGIVTGAFDGRPACALLDHVAVSGQALVVALLHAVDADTVFLNSGPLFHVGTAMSTFATLLQGGTNVFVPDADAEGICRAVVDHGVTRAFVVEPTRSRIVELVAQRGYDLRSLRGWPGSEAWNAIVTPDDSLWGRDVGGYGQTEVMGHVSFRGLAPGAEGEHGRTSPLVEVEILDDDGGPVPPGTVGELAVRGPQVMTGYHDRPDEDAHRWRTPRWQRTRDLGRREADGSLTFVGPKARMLKSGVENIYPAEVEACIATHPDVAACAVIGVPDPVWTQDVCAVVVPRAGTHPDLASIAAHCRDRIASYKKPKHLVLVDALPTVGGRVDHAALDAAHGGGGYPGGKVRAVTGAAS
jgi:long-chain acyl-CoA synthetase